VLSVLLGHGIVFGIAGSRLGGKGYRNPQSGVVEALGVEISTKIPDPNKPPPKIISEIAGSPSPAPKKGVDADELLTSLDIALETKPPSRCYHRRMYEDHVDRSKIDIGSFPFAAPQGIEGISRKLEQIVIRRNIREGRNMWISAASEANMSGPLPCSFTTLDKKRWFYNPELAVNMTRMLNGMLCKAEDSEALSFPNRFVYDNIINPNDCEKIVCALRASNVTQELRSKGGESCLGVPSETSRKVLPVDVRKLIRRIVDKSRELVMKESILERSWVAKRALISNQTWDDSLNISSGAENWQYFLKNDPSTTGMPDIAEAIDSFEYWHPRVDKAQMNLYDVSLIIFLSNHTTFQGGGEIFEDPDDRYLVSPKQGRLIMFGSGYENLHSVQRVTQGSRIVLELWLSLSEEEKVDKHSKY